MPEAILLQDVPQLGAKGAVVDVSKGYLRNYLLPRNLAAPATKTAIADAARQAEAQSRQRAEAVAQARELADQLTNTVLTISHQTGEDGRLFGSVTNQDIAEELEKQGYKIAKSQIRLPNGPVKTTGDNTVTVQLHTDVTVDITVTVYGETA